MDTRRAWLIVGLMGSAAFWVYMRAKANNQSVADFVQDSASEAAQLLTRGLRNNNPTNIRHGDKWQGMAAVQGDSDFITFLDPAYGIRAAATILKNYATRHRLTTIRGIVSRWAPPSENDTEAYIAAVSRSMGVGADVELVYPRDLPALIAALVHQENGIQPYTLAKIQEGVNLA